MVIMSRSTRFAFISFAALIGFALPAAAQWDQAYREGVRAYEKRNYADAASYFQQALSMNPRASEDTININGGFNVTYTPSQYLAASFANLGQCDQAQDALRGAVGTARGGDSLVSQAKRKCPSLDATPGPTAAEIAAAKAKADREKADAAKAEAARLERERQANVDAQKLADQQKAAQTAKLADAQKAAEAQKLADAQKAADLKKAQEAAARLTAAKQSLEAKIGEANAILTVSTTADAGARDTLTKAIASATTGAQTFTADTQVVAATDTLNRAITKFRSATVATADDTGTLRQILQLYVSGKYSTVPIVLQGASIASNTIKAQVALIRAAAAFAQAIIDRDPDPKSKIAKDLREYKRLQGGPPDPRLFSPAFRAVVSQQ